MLCRQIELLLQVGQLVMVFNEKRLRVRWEIEDSALVVLYTLQEIKKVIG